MNRLEKLIWLESWYNENKADLQGQPALVKAIKANSQVQSIIESLYFQLFNRPLNGCGSCLADGLAVLLHYSKKNINSIMNCRFKLKAGVLLADPFNRLPMVTSGNLTDELAIAYIKKNPARKSLFEELPDDLDELLSDAAQESNSNDAEEAGISDQVEAEKAESPAEETTEQGEGSPEVENAADAEEQAEEESKGTKGKTQKSR